MANKLKQKWIRRVVGILILLLVTSPVTLCISQVWIPARYKISSVTSPDGKWTAITTLEVYISGPLAAGDYGDYVVELQSRTGRLKEKIFQADDGSVKPPEVTWKDNEHVQIKMYLMKERQVAFQAINYYGIGISYDLDYRFK